MRKKERVVRVRPLRFGSWSEAFRYAKDDVKGPVVVEIVAPAEEPGLYQVYPDGGAIRQLGESEAKDDQGAG
jgi:hypothetical protein